MSVQLGYACITCRKGAPNVGDGGILGTPSLDLAEDSSVGIPDGYGPMPSFGLLYAGLFAIGLLPHDIERCHEFLTEHAGHRLFLDGELDGPVPDDVRDYQDVDSFDAAEWKQEKQAREARVAAGEFVEAYFALSCDACGSEVRASGADLLKAHPGKRILPADSQAFLTAWNRGPDEGWCHRLMGIVDPWEPFLPALVAFVETHAAHELTAQIAPAPAGSSHYQNRG